MQRTGHCTGLPVLPLTTVNLMMSASMGFRAIEPSMPLPPEVGSCWYQLEKDFLILDVPCAIEECASNLAAW